jgi:hypothetical protein
MPKHDHSTLKVLRSAGGYYVGMFCPKLDWLNSLDEDDPDARL